MKPKRNGNTQAELIEVLEAKLVARDAQIMDLLRLMVVETEADIAAKDASRIAKLEADKTQ